MPAGSLITVPVPVPALITVISVGVPDEVNVAVTLCAALMAATQVPVPVQPAPFQPENVEPAAGLADSVTLLFAVKLALQLTPQLIPAGLLITVPAPVPAFDTVSVCGTDALNVAVTLCAVLMVTAQVAVPLQPPPLQPANVEPADGLAVSVTLLFAVKLALHVAPQLIPAGLLVTVPVPVPALDTVSVGSPGYTVTARLG